MLDGAVQGGFKLMSLHNLTVLQAETILHMSMCLWRLQKGAIIFPMLVCTYVPVWIVNTVLILHGKRFLITFNKGKYLSLLSSM